MTDASTEAATETEAVEVKPTETVDYWKQRSRENEKQAKSNADAAKRLEAIEAANQTDAEKVAKRLAAADAEVAAVPARVAEALKTHLVELHKINDEDAGLFLNATDPETMLKQVSRLMEREAASSTDRKKQGNYVPREGATPAPDGGSDREVVRQLFQG